MESVIPICVAAFGAGFQELLYWYELREKLHHKKYDELMKSRRYWIAIALWVIACGFGTVLWFHPDGQPLRTYMVAGAAFPALLKRAAGAYAAKKPTTLGAESTLSHYLRQQ